MANNDERKLDTNDFSDEEIIKSAISSTLSIDGVSRLTGGLTETLGKNLFGFNSSLKGVKLSHDDDQLSFDIYVIVKYHAKIPQLAWDIQGKVKEDIEELTKLRVSEVNIHVQGVDLPGEDKQL